MYDNILTTSRDEVVDFFGGLLFYFGMIEDRGKKSSLKD